jgi:hypothetical protein
MKKDRHQRVRIPAGWGLGLALVALSAALAYGALRICPGCGTEALGEENVCRHCGAAVPAAAPVPPVQEPEPESGEPAAPAAPALTPEMARAEEGEARARLARGDWAGALLWGRNAVALYSLQGAEGLAAAVKLDGSLVELRRSALRVPRTCPACEGSGTRRIQMVTLTGARVERDAPGAPCPVCKGRKTLPGLRTAEEIEAALVNAGQAYALLQRQKGREEWYGLWLPAGLPGPLEIRRVVALRKGFGVLCPDCAGFGRSGCDSCGGTGALPCGNDACVQGEEFCPDCDGTGRFRDSDDTNTMVLTCPGCKGVGRRACSVCEGRGLTDCPDCDGSGERVCRRCKGAGRAPACTRCGATGLSDCTRCDGTGLDRGAACAECKTEGVMPCRSCGGTGASSK